MSADAPRLRADLAIVEQTYRDEKGFIVKDHEKHAYYRFRPVEVQVMRLFDGVNSVDDVAASLAREGVRISAAAIEGFARKLSSLGLLERTLREKATQQLERLRAERGRRRSLVRGELFRLRIPFGDPDAFLTRTYPLVRWCFTPAFVVVSLLLFAAYLAISVGRAEQFAREVAAFGPGRLTPFTIALVLLLFAVLTLIHEMGHAYACKHFGGEVHEMGFMFLFFMPAFYANVNDAWSFPEKRARLWVTAAGGWIELAVTSVLAIAWLTITPGSVFAQVAVAAMLVGGVANILTNANPLIPLDGYFALGDWLEVTNLRHRARELTGAWFRRVVLRLDVPEPAATSRERRIFLWYGILSFLYVVFFLGWIALRVVTWIYASFGFLPAALVGGAILFAARGSLRAAAGALVLVVSGRGSVARRRRIAVGLLVLLLVAAFVPAGLTATGVFTVLPLSTHAVTAPGNGAVSAVFVRAGDQVAPGAPVVRVADYALAAEQAVLGREADSLASFARRASVRQLAGEGEALAADAERARSEVARAEARSAELRVRARSGGTVVTPYPERLLGRDVRFGDTLLVVSDLSRLEAVVRLDGAGAGGVRAGHRVRLLSHAAESRAFEGEVASVSPVAGASRAVEARVRVPADWQLVPGSTGEARVTWRRTTLLGALVWAVRSRVRGDLLL